MRKIVLWSLALVVAVMGFVGGISERKAQAENNWQPEVLVSSSKVRLEVMVTGYDPATNKYKYQFSWLMPKYRTYSITIDGKVYQGRLTKNGVIETPYWFSPDITYTIDVYPYANARGASLGKGTFKAPTVTLPTPPEQIIPLTEEEEFVLLFNYFDQLPKIPNQTVSNKDEALDIWNLLIADSSIKTYEEERPMLSIQSQEVLDLMPIFRDNLYTSTGKTEVLTPKYRDIKVYKGREYASIKMKVKDLFSGDVSSYKLYFIKENNVWKIDFLQTFKPLIY